MKFVPYRHPAGEIEIMAEPEPYSDFDPVLHGIEEGFAYLDRLIELDAIHGIMYSDAESARDNLGIALTKYRERV